MGAVVQVVSELKEAFAGRVEMRFGSLEDVSKVKLTTNLELDVTDPTGNSGTLVVKVNNFLLHAICFRQKPNVENCVFGSCKVSLPVYFSG